MKAADGRKPAPGRPSQRPDALTRPDKKLLTRNGFFAQLVGRPLELPTMTVEQIAKQFGYHPATVRRGLASVGVRMDDETDAAADDNDNDDDNDESDRNTRIERNARRRRTKPQPRYSGRDDAA